MQAQLTVPSPRPGVWNGLRCLFSGFGWLLSTPGAWPYAAVPLLLFLVLASALGVGAVVFVPDWIADALGPSTGTWSRIGAGALRVLGTVAAVAVSTLIALALAQPLSGPALERLVRMQEAKLGAPERPETPFLLDVGRSLKSMLVGYAFGLPAALILLVLGWVLPFAVVVTVPLNLLVAAFTIGWDICDYPLSVRGMRVRDRVRILWRHKSAVLGFSFGLALAALVPCLLFLFLPAGVAGATRLIHELERHEGAQAARALAAPTAPMPR
jgi:CysZ protein